MKRAYQEKEVLARGKTVYIGIDVHKDSWHVTARTEGEEIFHGRMPSRYHALQSLFDRFHECIFKVAYEAGPCGFWLYDKLTQDCIEAIVVPPSLIPIESGNKVKTDKRDSRKLATLLENNMLKKVHVLTEEERAHRELVRTRRQIVNKRNGLACQIKSKLLFHGIKCPLLGKETWSKRYITWLKELTLERESLKTSFQYLIELYEYLSVQIVRITKKVIELSKTEKYRDKVDLLRTIPGIGKIIAIELLVELQDIERFKSAENISSYLGLTPSEYSTGQYVRQGRITRCGNSRARTCLVESSWFLIAKDPFMGRKYMKLKNRRGAKRAIIAIARNLIVRIRAMLLNNEPYIVGAIGI
jgi:transposase